MPCRGVTGDWGWLCVGNVMKCSDISKGLSGTGAAFCLNEHGASFSTQTAALQNTVANCEKSLNKSSTDIYTCATADTSGVHCAKNKLYNVTYAISCNDAHTGKKDVCGCSSAEYRLVAPSCDEAKGYLEDTCAVQCMHEVTDAPICNATQWTCEEE